MPKILKNTTGSPITITDVGVTIGASSQITIAPQDYLLYAASSNVVTFIGAGTIVVNDGSSDLSINQGTSLIQGNFPSSILSRTQDGAGTAVTSTLVSGKQSLDANITASALPAGAATSANQTTTNSSLSAIDTKTPALGQALAAASVPVVLTAAQITTLTPLTTVASTQSGPWNVTNITGTVSLPTGAATAANQTTTNASVSSIDTKTPALGQALAAASVPVVLTASQITTLTPLTTVAVTQSTSPWVTSRNWNLGSGTDSVAAVQSGVWNVTNISGTVSLPTGAATETTLAAASAKLPASLGPKTGAASFSVVPNTDTPFPSSQSGTWNITNISGTVSLPTGASTSASQTTGNVSLASVDGKLTASNTSLASIDGKITTVNTSAVVISSSALPTGAATSALQTTGNASLSSLDTKTPALGQALAAASSPVVLTAAQITTLTPLATIAATQSGSWNITNITGTVSLPTGAATSANQTLTNGPVTPGAVATQSNLIGGQYNRTKPVVGNGQQVAVQVNSRGNLMTASDLDSPNFDAMNRMRVSDPAQILGYTFSLSENRLSFNYLLTTAGTVTHVPVNACLRLAATTASGSSAVVQSRRYTRYTSGVSHMVHQSIVVGAAKANVRKRWGYFDANDGLFFQQTLASLSVVVRTSTSGATVDTVIDQAAWNVDLLDGTGPSGYILDVTKDNLYFLDFTWHGAARVRFGVLFNGLKVHCHEFDGSNTFTVPYMRTAFLPVRAEITNTAATASATSMDFIAGSVFKESSEPYLPAYNFGRSTARTLKTVGATALPFLSIRPRTTFATITNRIIIEPAEFQVFAGAIAVIATLVLNPTLTGATFADVDTAFSSTQFDTAATAFTGGTVIGEYLIQINTTATFDLRAFADAILLGLDIPGTTADILTIVLQSTAGNSSCGAAFRWGEFQ